MTDLKPCPFCGEVDIRFHAVGREGGVTNYYIGCKTCSTPATNFYPTKEVAIAKWNRRPPQEESYIDIVFNPAKAPGGEVTFVEVEDGEGRSINAGEWTNRDDGLVALRIRRSVFTPDTVPEPGDATEEALRFVDDLESEPITSRTRPQWGVPDLWRYVDRLHKRLDVHAAMDVIESGRDLDPDLLQRIKKWKDITRDHPEDGPDDHPLTTQLVHDLIAIVLREVREVPAIIKGRPEILEWLREQRCPKCGHESLDLSSFSEGHFSVIEHTAMCSMCQWHQRLEWNAEVSDIRPLRDVGFVQEETGEAECTCAGGVGALCETHDLCIHNVGLLFPDNKRLHALLYVMLRDHITVGSITDIVRDLEQEAAVNFTFTNRELSALAASLLARLLVIPSAGQDGKRVCPQPGCEKDYPHVHPQNKI